MANGLSNKFVSKICSKLFGNHFLGVFPCDIHPNTNHRKKYSIIFNTGDSGTSGEHFVALYMEKNKLFYFDSFGKKPTDKNVLSFINNQKKKLICWKKKIQHEDSYYCGFFCIAFLLHKHKKIPNFCKKILSKKLHLNNDRVVKFISKNMMK